ncbi:hypothetical protein [Desulfosporosinus nitroreducens]|nr:hypothetical protein [Desulfosporosinus nitroreducens]
MNNRKIIEQTLLKYDEANNAILTEWREEDGLFVIEKDLIT